MRHYGTGTITTTNPLFLFFIQPSPHCHNFQPSLWIATTELLQLKIAQMAHATNNQMQQLSYGGGH